MGQTRRALACDKQTQHWNKSPFYSSSTMCEKMFNFQNKKIGRADTC